MVKTKRKLSRQKVKPKATKSKIQNKIPKKLHLKNVDCEFIGVKLTRKHSESNGPMSANIRPKYCMHVVYCMHAGICGQSCLREKSSTRLQYSCLSQG